MQVLYELQKLSSLTSYREQNLAKQLRLSNLYCQSTKK